MINKIMNLGFSKVEANELLKVSKDINKDYEKLLNKYPIQYLIGYVNFYGYRININDNVLIPRYETEYLVEKTINYIKKYFEQDINILDMCTGSGAIAIALSKELNCNVDASDISIDALNAARSNSNELNCNVNFIESDIFSNINNKYDVIISNPPYISKNEEIQESVHKYEPNIALYADNEGLYFYEQILKDANNYLNDHSMLAFEIGMAQANKIKNIAINYFPKAKVLIEKDLSGKDRYVFIINE